MSTVEENVEWLVEVFELEDGDAASVLRAAAAKVVHDQDEEFVSDVLGVADIVAGLLDLDGSAAAFSSASSDAWDTADVLEGSEHLDVTDFARDVGKELVALADAIDASEQRRAS